MDQYYRTVEAAAILGVTPATISLWIKNGNLKAEKLSPFKERSAFRIPKSEVDRILELRKRGANATAQG